MIIHEAIRAYLMANMSNNEIFAHVLNKRVSMIFDRYERHIDIGMHVINEHMLVTGYVEDVAFYHALDANTMVGLIFRGDVFISDDRIKDNYINKDNKVYLTIRYTDVVSQIVIE